MFVDKKQSALFFYGVPESVKIGVLFSKPGSIEFESFEELRESSVREVVGGFGYKFEGEEVVSGSADFSLIKSQRELEEAARDREDAHRRATAAEHQIIALQTEIDRQKRELADMKRHLRPIRSFTSLAQLHVTFNPNTTGVQKGGNVILHTTKSKRQVFIGDDISSVCSILSFCSLSFFSVFWHVYLRYSAACMYSFC